MNTEPTYLDLLAFDIAMRDAQAKGIRIPTWLCTSDEAKETMRKNALDQLSNKLGWTISPKAAEELIQRQIGASRFKLWIDFEQEMAREREKGNPQAFFV